MIQQNIVRILRTSANVQRIFVHRLFVRIHRTKIVPIKFIVGATLLGRFTKLDTKSKADTTKEMLAEADALFEQGQYSKIYENFKDYKDGNSADMLWRLSRALYHMSKDASKEESKAMIYEAYDLVSKALSLTNDDAAVHKWFVVLTDAKSTLEGIKARIKTLQMSKDHMLRSSELNPRDATILYMLGNWCYHVADLTWYQRKIATLIFAEPPYSSFEEALRYSLKAEEIDPNFYSQNLLLLGKTYLKLNDKDEARRYLKMASDYPAKNNDDRDAQKEAAKLLNSI